MSTPATRRVIPIAVSREPAFGAAQREAVDGVCKSLSHLPGALLPILHDIQQRLGFIPKESVPLIAAQLNLSLAEVHGVISFYHYFRTSPPGVHVMHLCRAEACQALGAAELEAHACRTLGISMHGTTADGAISLEPVYCLGNCALGPSLMVDERLIGRVTPQRFDELVATARGKS
jgi:formate dehydrogenase subunit gamma